MQKATLIGIDLGKHSFNLHGQGYSGKEVFRKKISRKQLITFFGNFHACAVVMEAYSGAHWMSSQADSTGPSGQTDFTTIRSTFHQNQQE